MQDNIKKEGFAFAFDPKACETCAGNCCIGESGYIWLTPAEIGAIADFLQMEQEAFRAAYLRKVGYRQSLKERRNGTSYECIFFDPVHKRCAIYPVRPTQCRTFPFWDYFKNRIEEVEKECPGIIRLG